MQSRADLTLLSPRTTKPPLDFSRFLTATLIMGILAKGEMSTLSDPSCSRDQPSSYSDSTQAQFSLSQANLVDSYHVVEMTEHRL
jgi:hypothetical protein